MAGLRFALLVACLAAGVAAGVFPADWLPYALQFVVAAVATVAERRTRARPWVWYVEALAAGVVVGLSADTWSVLGLYLLAPVSAASQRWRGRTPWLVWSAAAMGVALGFAIGGTWYASAIGWCLVAGLGLATVPLQEFLRPADEYRSAHRLLRRLRSIARQLPSGLDEVALAQQTLEQFERIVPSDRGVLFLRQEGSLVPYAVRGTDRVPGEPTPRTTWDRRWRSAEVLTGPGAVTGQTCHEALIPLIVGDSLIGIVLLQNDRGPFDDRQLRDARLRSADAALRIDSGRLFAEVRTTATAEERRRVAREIHDGIAQELASLGYRMDLLVSDLAGSGYAAEAEEVRSEIRRIVSEVRLSIFDLRADVQPGVGLGPALTSYVRQAGTDAGLTVHLVIEEGVQRLPVGQETELLRIAQEAVTNVRRHAAAENLWVTCRLSPPYAFLQVADDGSGPGSPRKDSFGLAIMQERADRIGATLVRRRREGGGTVLEVVLEPPAVEQEVNR